MPLQTVRKTVEVPADLLPKITKLAEQNRRSIKGQMEHMLFEKLTEIKD